jgi:tetratricopeptide (TPR) repeat protein
MKRRHLTIVVLACFSANPSLAAPRLLDELNGGNRDWCDRTDVDPDATISGCATMIAMHFECCSPLSLSRKLTNMGVAYRRKGEEDLAKRHFDLALRALSEELSRRSDDINPLAERCRLLGIYNAQLDMALADCQRAHQIKPDDKWITGILGFVLHRLGRYQEALDNYSASLGGERNDDIGFMYLRGVVKQKLGDDAGSIVDINEANRRDRRIPLKYKYYGVEPERR